MGYFCLSWLFLASLLGGFFFLGNFCLGLLSQLSVHRVIFLGTWSCDDTLATGILLYYRRVLSRVLPHWPVDSE